MGGPGPRRGRGWHLLLLDRDAARLEDAPRNLAAKRSPHCDAVAGDLLETPAADWRWILGINVMGVVHACRAEAPDMIASGGGLIVNMSRAPPASPARTA